MPIRIPGTWRTEEVDGKRYPLQWHYVLADNDEDDDDEMLDLRKELNDLDNFLLGFKARRQSYEDFERIFLGRFEPEPEPRDHPDILNLLEES